MKVLIFGFRGTIAEKVLAEISIQCEKILIDSTKSSIEYLLSSDNLSGYTHILGLGAYNGRDTDKMRIETQCTNQFRNESKSDKEFVDIEPFLGETNQMKYSKGIGNSWCNLVSYRIKAKALNSKYTFIHIPKSFNVNDAVSIIDYEFSSKYVH